MDGAAETAPLHGRIGVDRVDLAETCGAGLSSASSAADTVPIAYAATSVSARPPGRSCPEALGDVAAPAVDVLREVHGVEALLDDESGVGVPPGLHIDDRKPLHVTQSRRANDDGHRDDPASRGIPLGNEGGRGQNCGTRRLAVHAVVVAPCTPRHLEAPDHLGQASDDVRGCSSMVEPQPSKLAMPVRSRSPAPHFPRSAAPCVHGALLSWCGNGWTLGSRGG